MVVEVRSAVVEVGPVPVRLLRLHRLLLLHRQVVGHHLPHQRVVQQVVRQVADHRLLHRLAWRVAEPLHRR